MAKIVHITTVHPALDVRIFQKQCRTLARAGHDVTLIAPVDASGHAGCVERIAGVTIKRLPNPNGRLERMLYTTRLALRAALQLDADLYHLHDPELLPIVGRLQGRCRAVVFDMHENLPKDLLHKRWLPCGLRGPISLAARLAQRWFLSRLPVVLAEDSYADDYPWLSNATVVRNMPLVDELLAVVAEQPANGCGCKPPARPTVGYLGSITPARGSLVMLEALAILQKRGIRCGLELIGPTHDVFTNDPLADTRDNNKQCQKPSRRSAAAVRRSHAYQLRQKAEQLALDDVRLSGWLPAPQAWRRIARCRVGLAVLQDRPNFRDSLPTKMFEYMTLGLPVVVSDFPLYRRIVEAAGCGICVDPADPGAMADALARLLTNPAEAKRMGSSGRRAVLEHYRWDKEARRLLSLYDRLLGPADA